VPFQFDMSRSSPSARPYEQASRIQISSDQFRSAAADSSIVGVSIPAPSPFSPFSSSSSSLKFLGTLAAMMTV